MPITDEQVTLLRNLVDKLATDKSDGNTKSQVLTSKDAAAAVANSDALKAKTDKETADGLIEADVLQIQEFINALVLPPPPVPVTVKEV